MDMMKFDRIVCTILLTFLQIYVCFSQVSVSGYYKKDGTYVQPHQRTSPNNTITDNYSYPGNYNPNNGQTTGGKVYDSVSDVVSPFTKPQKKLPNNGSPITIYTNTYSHCFGDCTDSKVKKDSKIYINDKEIQIVVDGQTKHYLIKNSEYTHELNTNGDLYYIDVFDGYNKLTALFYTMHVKRTIYVDFKPLDQQELIIGLNVMNYYTNEKHIYEIVEKQ